MVKNVFRSSCKVPLILARFEQKVNFYSRFTKIFFSETKFYSIRPVGAEVLHSDGRTEGQTDVAKLMVAFHNFANVP
jgi:hypothetical protein